MSEPTTENGRRLLDRSAWDEGLRCHRVRVLNPAGPEDLRNALLAIEQEARKSKDCGDHYIEGYQEGHKAGWAAGRADLAARIEEAVRGAPTAVREYVLAIVREEAER